MFIYKHFYFYKIKFPGWGCSSEIRRFSSMCEDLGMIPSTTKRKTKIAKFPLSLIKINISYFSFLSYF
jgi:hypothetical protein